MPLQLHETGGTSVDPDASLAESGALNRALIQLATRIESILLEEKKALASQPNDLEFLVARKEHLALDVLHLSQVAGGAAPDASVRARLAMTGRLLAENSGLLRRHIDAVSEIAALVAGVVNRSNGDGTYSVSREVGRRQAD